MIYFDNGATTQKPKQVIDSIINYYSNLNSNVHRGVHTLSQEATTAFEEARKHKFTVQACLVQAEEGWSERYSKLVKLDKLWELESLSQSAQDYHLPWHGADAGADRGHAHVLD